jgi:dienelactone hydrolase
MISRPCIQGLVSLLCPVLLLETVFAVESASHASHHPGDGYPGRLTAYEATPELQMKMDRFNLTAGWFRRAPINPETYRYEPHRCPVNELPYLLFSPGRGRRPVPMVLYFGGTGEHGTNLVDQFRQTTVFEKVTSPDFQKRHPCYLFAPMLPKGGAIRSGQTESPSNLSDLVCDAMYAVIKSLDDPPVDVNRLYLTGLSWGAVVSWELPRGFPGRFAASVPVSGSQGAGMIPKTKPGNYWLLYNESAYRTPEAKQTLVDLAQTIEERGGDFRVATFPDVGHDAWSKAWREDRVWDWMFSKTTDGRPVDAVPAAGPRSVAPKQSSGALLDGVVCTASQPGADAGHGPERAADNLDATCYVSAGPMKRGDWWRVEFPEPVTGRIVVHSGTRDGADRLSAGRVEVSRDGRFWNRAAPFSRTTGTCAFIQRSPIRHLRVLPEPAKPEVLTLREIGVE